MALSDWLAGNGKFKKDTAKKPTVATVANDLLHLEQENPQQTSAFAPTVAEIATVAEDSSNNIYNEYIYIKSKNNYSSDSATLATLATGPDKHWPGTVADPLLQVATLATLDCLKTDCSCSTDKQPDCIFSAVAAWIPQCAPSQTLTIPAEHLEQIDELQSLANDRIRFRNPELRVWREDKDKLACKAFFGPEAEPYYKPKSNSSRFRNNASKRIKTMWNPEDGWCRWDSTKQDYVPDPSLNFDEIEGATTRNQ